jgi:hypothetical protein
MSDDPLFHNCPRYDKHELSEDQIIDIAKRAVLLAKDEVYKDLGKTVTEKFFTAVGVVMLGLYTWLNLNGYLKGG